MKRSFSFIPRLLITALGVCFLVSPASAQSSYFGPFQPDGNTVLLMHFDGDVQDAATTRTASFRGEISYITNDQLPGGDFDKQLRIHNRYYDQFSYLQFPDHSDYDLKGAWTMQLWFNIFTTGNDHRQDPRLLIKPGEPHYHSNFYVYLFTGEGRFATGYHERSGSASWQQVTTSENTIQPGRWYYLSYIRDTQQSMLVQILHRVDSEGNPELVSFKTKAFDSSAHDPPNTTSNPLFIGRGGATRSQRFDGFMDELRISNSARKSNIPDLVKKIEPGSNHPSSQPIRFVVDHPNLPASIGLDSVALYYRINQQEFKRILMDAENREIYSATISGQQEGTRIDYYIKTWSNYGVNSRTPYNEPGEENYHHLEVGSTTSLDPRANHLPQSIQLEPNYPNPFNPSTTISYTLPKPMEATLSVYTVDGRKIATLVNEHQPAGNHEIRFEPDNLGSGLYLYILKTETQKQVGKMTLIK